MKRTTFTFLLAMMWPSLQALFTVEPEQDSYDGELHKNIRIACRFSPVESVTQLSVFWQRIDPLPTVDVYRLEKGLENHNFTDKSFQKRARLLKDELEKYRAVLELSQLQMSDSGTYQCVVSLKEVDYKKTTLTVRAPYTAIKKDIKRLDNEKVELSCESQGFPLAHMVWSDGRLQDLTVRSNSSSEKTSEGIYKVTSQVTVSENIINNYTCSISLEGKVRQSVTFNIPGEIPGKSKWCHAYAAIGVIVVMCMGFVAASVIVHRRKKGQKNRDSICKSSERNLTVTSTDSLLPKTPFFRADTFAFSSEVCKGKAENLREVLEQKYAELSTMAGFTLQHSLLCGESQCELQSIVPGRGEAILLEGEEGSGKSSLAKKLAFSWADGSTSDPFNISKTWLVILLDFEEAEGDFFQVVKTKIPSEAELETADVKEILLGNTDSLLILDSYKEGSREMDESLIKFLKDRSACRVLITARPGQHSNLVDTVTKTLQLQR
ncbi:programmed cell death 1 ligand 1-like [Pygocentrus nattereri]|uniref:programmed cell death 1 ligand 1-like n=1 Tax=Pygocentrus nattereri TaxID=42514 RepID=UPI000814A103|nr:programmed cell death 1 ligand 1-like [Pygocentrus nattereri]XP_017569226.1 programmed cell death 1 ligand 1-like [Pygocentrus nattereri]